MSDDAPLPDHLKPSPLVERLLAGGAQPGGQVTIIGYIGRSPHEGHVRIYLDLKLSSYCDVAADDVVGTAPVDSESEISPSMVWLKVGAKIERVDTSRSTTVLQGQIQESYLEQAIGNYATTLRNLLYKPVKDPSAAPSCIFCPTPMHMCPSDICPPPSTGWCHTDGCPA
jgi:hypothetical protein